jgi:MFS family permease
MPDRKVLLSTLWLFATLNYLYCDVVTLMDPVKHTGSIQLTPGFLLGASILVEIPIAMVLLSRIVPYQANRWLNIIAGTFMTVVQIATLFVGTPTLYYLFFSVIEIATTAFIVWYAWRWRNPSSPGKAPTPPAV